MKILSITNDICLMIAAACLATGYILGRHWLIVPAFLIMVLFWMITKKRSVFWSASCLLLVYVFLAAIGVIANLSLSLMVVGCTTALVSWDLAHFNHGEGNPLFEAKGSLEKHHMQSLSVMYGASLLLALIASFINLQISFGILVFLVLMAMGCLTYSMQFIMKKNRDS
jgi:4-hydroxybenzoate polyprenyltransferase